MVAAQSNQRMILPQGAHQVGTPVPLEKPDIHFGRRGGKKVQLTIVLIRCDYTDETQHILEEVNKANCELISVFRTYFRKQLSPEKRGGFDAADLANLLGTAMVGAIYQSLRFPSDYRLDKHGVRAISQVFALIRRASLSGT
jgi:hypothetical protein